ncbi:MAG: SDR family oxidoreductase [Pseudomonadota bacterium]
MGTISGQRALVTGASAGIGAAVVRALAAEGAEVHALARRADRLNALAAATGAVPHATDMRDLSALERVVAASRPAILVNNAGLGAGIAGLATASAAEIEETIATNVAALLQITRLAWPHLTAARGHIVNLGSVAGLYPINSAVYGGSKGAVRRISQNLRIELRGTGVRVTEICPGRVSTEFYDASVKDAAMREKLKTTGISELTAAEVADAILYALTAPRHVNISTIEIQPVEQTYGGAFFDPLVWEE